MIREGNGSKKYIETLNGIFDHCDKQYDNLPENRDKKWYLLVTFAGKLWPRGRRRAQISKKKSFIYFVKSLDKGLFMW